MPFSRVKWITFDIGGTLLFANPSVGAVYAEVLARYGFNRKAEVLEEAFMRVWRQAVLRPLKPSSPAAEKERWREAVVRAFADLVPGIDMETFFDDIWITLSEANRWRLTTHAESTLAALRDRGYRLAVLSNWDDRLRPVLTGLGLEPLFDEIFVSCEVGFEKPDERLFGFVEKRLGASGTEIVHIGDSHHHDILGATSRGWRAIQVFCETPADVRHPRVQCLSELLAFLPGAAPGSAPADPFRSHERNRISAS